jgi:hypothetical protein
MEKMKPLKATKAFMCSTDFDIDIPWNRTADFPTLYRTIKALKAERKCWVDCGITEVEVKFKRVVKRGTI